MNRLLIRSPAFDRDLRAWLKSRPATAPAVGAALTQLAADAAHPSLRTHKLKGPLRGSWACSAGDDLRIVFDFVQQGEQEAILLLALGTHEEVY